MSSQNGLDKWFKQDWVDIGSKKKGGGFKKCGRKSAKGSKRKYPKCVPASKAASMSEGERRSAVSRKRSAGNPGGKPTNVKTFTRKKASNGGYVGSFIDLNVEGKVLSNPSLKKYYKGMF